MKAFTLLLLLVSGFASGQDMPTILNPSPAYWYDLYRGEHERAEGLAKFGNMAISGLSDSLRAANATIVRVTKERDVEGLKRQQSESQLKPVADELDQLKGRTVAGRLLRKARDGLAGIGAVSVVVFTLKLIL